MSTYIPWRHHELPSGGLDFTGDTQENRNLSLFVELCATLGLSLVLKPGPFCHAELNYGGLPDRVRPGDRFAAQESVLGVAVTWIGATADADGQAEQWPLPSLADPGFMAEVDDWLLAVRERVLRPAAEWGVLVAIQVGNEGVYSDAQHPIWAHDGSAVALAEYRAWLATQYPDLASLSAAYGRSIASWSEISAPEIPTELPPLAKAAAWRDWSRWQAVSLGQRYAHWQRMVGVGVPVFANVNPPLGESWGIDAWLARVDPEDWDGVRYGYTNWIGLAAREPSALARYQLLTGIAPGPNLEENWGFSEQYDIRYQHPNVCFQQSLVALAGGAYGINFYTAISTDAWDEDLDRFEARPYPAHAAIQPHGKVWAMTDVVQDLAGYLAEFGEELALSQPRGAVGWAVDRAGARLAAWSGPKANSPGVQYLAAHDAATRARIDVQIADITRAAPDPERVPVLLVPGL
ncbi:MAG: beta-galactosidase, partial [Angustibacter sp.]